jgi:hypothetical protein
MGTQSDDRGGEKRQPQQPGRPGEQAQTQKQAQGGEKDPSRQAQDQGDERQFMTSDDQAGGDVDADAEVKPGQPGNQDRERSGTTRPRNP